MKARHLFAALTSLLLAGATALAQETPPADQNQTEVIGPPQLRDFSINGTVTRPAQEPAQTPPARQQQQQQQEPQQRSSATSADEPPRQPERAATQQAMPEPSAESGSPAFTARPTPAQPPLVPPVDQAVNSQSPDDMVEPVTEIPSPDSVPVLPWLIAALTIVAAGAWFVFRRRQSESFAGVGAVDLFRAPEPSPAAPPAPARRPAPRPVPAELKAETPPRPVRPDGVVVTSRLRPWLDIEFVPERGVTDDQKAAVKFQLTVANSGAVAARDVLIEASLFNAGPMQDQQLQLFFDNPVAKGDRIAAIAFSQRIYVKTAVFLPRQQIHPTEIEGRLLFIPVVAFNVIYKWSNGSGQTSASFLVGRQTESEKLGPFRLDLGPRIFRNLAARELDYRLRR